MTIWLALFAAALAGPGELLAPSLDDVRAALDDTEALIVESEELRRELVEVHHAWVESGCAARTCEHEQRVSLIWRSRVLGQSQRDAVQSARVSRDRLSRAAASPTVSPLLGDELVKRLEAASSAVERSVERWLVAAAWHERFLEPVAAWLGMPARAGACLEAPTDDTTPVVAEPTPRRRIVVVPPPEPEPAEVAEEDALDLPDAPEVVAVPGDDEALGEDVELVGVGEPRDGVVGKAVPPEPEPSPAAEEPAEPPELDAPVVPLPDDDPEDG